MIFIRIVEVYFSFKIISIAVLFMYVKMFFFFIVEKGILFF